MTHPVSRSIERVLERQNSMQPQGLQVTEWFRHEQNESLPAEAGDSRATAIPVILSEGGLEPQRIHAYQRTPPRCEREFVPVRSDSFQLTKELCGPGTHRLLCCRSQADSQCPTAAVD